MPGPTIAKVECRGNTLVLTTADNATITTAYTGPPIYAVDLAKGLQGVADAIKAQTAALVADDQKFLDAGKTPTPAPAV